MAENNRPIRILHLISTLDVGGAEQNLLRLLTSLDREAFQNEVVCMTQAGPTGRKISQAGSPVHSLMMKKGTPEIGAVLRLRFWANLYRPDIIQCWMYHANLLGVMLLRPKVTIWNIRCSDMDLSLYGAVYRFAVMAGARLSRIPNAIVANSISGRDTHENIGYHPKRWVIIPNGFDPDVFKPDRGARSRIRAGLNIPDNALVIGLIGRLDPMKDHATFFNAATIFLRTHPDACFILAGRGVAADNPRMRDCMGATADPRRFHLLGERDDVERILASIDIATSSSISEGFPNAIGEAMACGVPCVATDAGDTRLLMGDTGIVVNKQSPRELGMAWDKLASLSHEGRLEMGLRARQRIIQHFSQEATTQMYEQLFRQVL